MDDLIARAASVLRNSRHAIALTGAGISTESGIPDFRGPSGLWTRNPQAERQAYRSYERFLSDPRAWWEERLSASSLLGNLDNVLPNPGHYALAELEEMGILKCVITQNVDGLHETSGTISVIEYHGSLLKYRCVSCGQRYDRDSFDMVLLHERGQLPPRCPSCNGIVKSDSVAFGEPIPADVLQASMEEARRCDVMLICGTSAVVYPFANLPRVAKERARPRQFSGEDVRPAVTIIEVNAEPTPLTQEGISDLLIEGKTGEVLPRVVQAVKGLSL